MKHNAVLPNTADVVIIGAGAVGTAIARELSRYQLKVVLLEKEADVGCGASKANSAIIHTGFDAKPGTLESRLVTSANPMFDQLAAELDIAFRRTGALLVAVTEEEFAQFPAIQAKAIANGVMDISHLSREQLLKMEPHVNPAALGALYIPRESIISPFELVIALAENAISNGVEIFLETAAEAVVIEDGKVRAVRTNRGTIATAYVINAAGLFSDEVAAMAGLAEGFTVTPRRGQFYILDKKLPFAPRHIILPVPTPKTKGVLLTPTVEGNLLIGPTAEDLDDKFAKSTTWQGLNEVLLGVKRLVPEVDVRYTITQYAGLRAVKNPEGYAIEENARVKGFINVLGIRSTGVTSSPAVAKYVAQLSGEAGLQLIPKSAFIPVRRGIPRFRDLSWEEREQLIKSNPRYAHVVCRCETVTEAEIVAAIHSPLPATSLDAVKRRVRAGMGRCQAGFCAPKVMEILAREMGIALTEVTKSGGPSGLLAGKTKQFATCRQEVLLNESNAV